MNLFKKYTRSIALILALSLSSNSAIVCYDTAHLDHAFNSHLASFPAEIKEEVEKPKFDQEKLGDLLKSLFKPNWFTTNELSNHEQRERLEKETPSAPLEGSVIGTDYIDRLELLSGSGDHRADHILNRLTTITHDDETEHLLKTKVGEKRGREMLVQPTTDINEIKRRAAFIKALLKDELLLKQCEEQLAIFKKNENLFLNFFQKKDLVEEELLKNVYWKWMPHLNNSVEGLEAGTRLSNLGTTITLGLTPFILVRLWKNHYQHLENLENLPSEVKLGLGGFLACYFGIVYGIGASATLASARINKNVNNCLQEYLIGMAFCINSMKELYKLLGSHESLTKYHDSLCPLSALIKPSADHTYEFNLLIDLLDHNTFKGKPSFFSLTGRVLRAYKLTRQEGVMAEFAHALHVFGELDMYVAIAKKIKSQQDNPNAPFCFVNFIENSNKPYIKATKFWNIFVDPNKAVPNDIELGNGHHQNIILTGPNTGGKSTVMKAIMMDLLLAQTFGIAAAESMDITPFANLDTYINITDYTGGEVSGLKAEVLRAKQVIAKIKSLPRNQFSFVILDEIFKATSPDQAEKLAYKFLKELCEFENCMFIDATHFKNLVALEQEDPKCKNYHMGAVVDDQGHVTQYTYKLEEGPSTVQNAEQVAQDSDLW